MKTGKQDVTLVDFSTVIIVGRYLHLMTAWSQLPIRDKDLIGDFMLGCLTNMRSNSQQFKQFLPILHGLNEPRHHLFGDQSNHIKRKYSLFSNNDHMGINLNDEFVQVWQFVK